MNTLNIVLLCLNLAVLVALVYTMVFRQVFTALFLHGLRLRRTKEDLQNRPWYLRLTHKLTPIKHDRIEGRVVSLDHLVPPGWPLDPIEGVVVREGLHSAKVSVQMLPSREMPADEIEALAVEYELVENPPSLERGLPADLLAQVWVRVESTPESDDPQKVVQHIPAGVDVANPKSAVASTVADLDLIPWIAHFKTRPSFYRFSWSDGLLMAEFDSGRHWWCVAHGAEKFPGLPPWVPVKG